MPSLTASTPSDNRPSALIAASHEDSATERLGMQLSSGSCYLVLHYAVYPRPWPQVPSFLCLVSIHSKEQHPGLWVTTPPSISPRYTQTLLSLGSHAPGLVSTCPPPPHYRACSMFFLIPHFPCTGQYWAQSSCSSTH